MSGLDKNTVAGFTDVDLDSDVDISKVHQANQDNDSVIDVDKQIINSADQQDSNNKKIDIDVDKSQDNDNFVDIAVDKSQDNDTFIKKDLDFDASQDNDDINSHNTELNLDKSNSNNVVDSHNKTIDLDIDNSQKIVADDGAFAAGGNIGGQGAVFNSGVVKGVQGGPGTHVDGPVGDGNMVFDGVTGNVALGGSVTEVSADHGGNANLGGQQINASGHDAVIVTGDDNNVAGDQTANVGAARGGAGGGEGDAGPAVINFGNDSEQTVVNDQSETTVTSIDASVNDSFNKTDNSETNIDASKRIDASTEINDSLNKTLVDNSITDKSVDLDLTDNSIENHETFKDSFDTEVIDVDLDLDHVADVGVDHHGGLDLDL